MSNLWYVWLGLTCTSALGCQQAAAAPCVTTDDCTPGLSCVHGSCTQPEPTTCDNGLRDPVETDIDCGGPCPPCADGLVCNGDGDCASEVCAGGVCAPSRCGDGLVQGDEECDDGPDGSIDCTPLCQAATCADGVMNGDEIDVDCGGHCGPASCLVGQICADPGDCASALCDSNVCSVQRTIATGGLHTCLLFADGAVHCWGQNDAGQLGYSHTANIGDNETPYTQGQVDVGGAALQLAAGLQHTCALLDGGAVRCWGRNSFGQLGYGHTDTIGDNEPPASSAPVDVGGAVVQLAAGLRHTCARLDGGAVRCWGRNNFGQLGYGHTMDIGDDEAPSTAGDVIVGGPVVEIAAGGHHTCARLESGAVRCWGQNFEGQLGYGHTRHIGDDELPATAGDVPLGGVATAVGTGWYHTCAIMDTGAARCWGFNHYGQLGYGHDQNIGDDEPASAAGDVPLGTRITDIMVGNDYTCALQSTAHVLCWGNNDYGQLGYGHTRHIGDDEPVTTAGDVDVGGPVAQIAEGLGLHVCVLMTTGAVRCWGFNGYGQMGYGNTDTVGDNELPYTAGDVPCP